jgi:hypothetical protein
VQDQVIGDASRGPECSVGEMCSPFIMHSAHGNRRECSWAAVGHAADRGDVVGHPTGLPVGGSTPPGAQRFHALNTTVCVLAAVQVWMPEEEEEEEEEDEDEEGEEEEEECGRQRQKVSA